ncbi:hypothetical protein [Poseidonocella sp. HB161398]|uniref:hypothetical protein n=1 Tax=Poseidonocella sp. HB161398 TaxID=2320855 RepID=UPI0011084498|nr:hypothetical protein [Poseidonocella sp. HB161398]
MKFHFGVVLYHTSARDIHRLEKSIHVASEIAGIDYSLSLLLNSDESSVLHVEILERAKVIPFQKNLGFGKGHNKIVESLGDSTGFYVGLNPDGYVSPWAISAILDAAPVAGNLYEFQQFPQEHPKVFDQVTGETAWSSGAAFLIDIGSFRQVGGFDPSFFLYCEDVDLSWRVRERGGKCILLPRAIFFHDVSDERQNPRTYARMLLGQVQLSKKWGARRIYKRVLKQLRSFETRNGLGHLDLPEIPINEIRKSPPGFCNFGKCGSYSETRW